MVQRLTNTGRPEYKECSRFSFDQNAARIKKRYALLLLRGCFSMIYLGGCGSGQGQKVQRVLCTLNIALQLGLTITPRPMNRSEPLENHQLIDSDRIVPPRDEGSREQNGSAQRIRARYSLLLQHANRCCSRTSWYNLWIATYFPTTGNQTSCSGPSSLVAIHWRKIWRFCVKLQTTSSPELPAFRSFHSTKRGRFVESNIRVPSQILEEFSAGLLLSHEVYIGQRTDRREIACYDCKHDMIAWRLSD